MKRILIIGKTGSGKTTFADKLGKILGYEVTHLDDLFWNPDWERAYTAEEWLKKNEDMTQAYNWILDGNYHNTLEFRLSKADTVFFFEVNPFVALFNIIKRKYTTNDPNHNKFGLRLAIRTIFNFPTKKVLEQIEKSRVENVYIIKNKKDAHVILSEIIR
ncbi:AAA family ATPase [Candidatus Kaiserbacteria bacterium]|nr:AAA family ATPase [Candidatus Kaiserbacteria bacterium]